MANPLLAATPSNNAIVKASAGVGKTYLLVTRLIRLLLDDVTPDSILAITFTRKAAAEMQSRLYERLYELAICDETQAGKLLESIGVNASEASVAKAQSLYEFILQSPRQVKSTTFHAFCQDILQKFPLEADVPPGFDLLDDAATYQQTAWEMLYDEATRNPDSEVAQALESLFDLTGSIHSTQDALNSFLEQRADWWAYTAGSEEAVKYAIESLQKNLDFNENENIYALIFNDLQKKRIYRIIELWDLHGTPTIKKLITQLQPLLETNVFENHNLDDASYESTFKKIWSVFFNTKNEIRETKPSKARAKKMGEAGEEEFLQSFAQIGATLQTIKEKFNVKFNIEINQAWYKAGNRLCEIYQQIKAEQRLLDFTDLEWKTYQLLNNSDNAQWVQYKLDQRIKHLLIDEFQDTNPTQWRLLLPIMQEFQFNNEELKSVFIVGDEKQSIYSFRRADPLLLNQAGCWLQENLNGAEFPMDMSRRSAPQVMQLVNSVFQSEEYQKILPSFSEHSTHLQNTPGWLRLLPLVEESDESEEEITFRNPLEQARLEKADPYLEEGRLIAETIQQLINSKTGVNHGNEIRPVSAGDIMLLVRSRSHVKQYEKALRELNIPYLSNNKGTLFDCQEIQDMIALLNALYSPYNDIALATILRCPIFNCSNEDLLFFYQTEKRGSWFELLCESDVMPARLEAAKQTILRWRTYALALPIHDMLDKVYHESNIMQCYAEQYPKHLVPRAHNNLSQFLALALQVDSGRYPSLGRFLARLETLRQADASPDEATSSDDSAVRILTIHASKGLEAPIVFLADSCDAKNSKSKHYQTIVQWPQDSEKPTVFRLCPTKDYLEASMKNLLEEMALKEKTEDANLLYVALTRARQAVYVSGTSKKAEAKGWYKAIQENWPTAHEDLPVTAVISAQSTTTTAYETEFPELFNSTEIIETVITEEENEDSQARGIIIHRALELLTGETQLSRNDCLQQLFNEYSSNEHNQIKEFYQEAVKVLENPDFAQYFDSEKYVSAFNEIPLQTTHAEKSKLGIIDRLVISDKNCFIVDYKTHSECNASQLDTIAASYNSQMRFYQKMIRDIWPEKIIKCIILFTHFNKSVEIR